MQKQHSDIGAFIDKMILGSCPCSMVMPGMVRDTVASDLNRSSNVVFAG